MLTVDTVTDAQIRALLFERTTTVEVANMCRLALGWVRPAAPSVCREAREDCAKFLNARNLSG